MNWLQAVILILCILNAVLLLALVARRPRESPRKMRVPLPPDSIREDLEKMKNGSYPGGKKDESVILLTPERDARIMDGEEG